MKTNRQDACIDSQNSQVSRRQRTRSAFTCESLEGRKLMTGFAGAADAMMPMGGPAEMGGMTDSDHGPQGDSVRFKEQHQAGGTEATESGTMSTSTLMRGGATGQAFSAHQGHLGVNRGGSKDFHGGMMEGKPGGWMTGDGSQGDSPMSGQTGTTAGSDKSTGNTQLDTDLAKLKTDEQAIHDKSEVTPKLMAAVRNDLQAIDKAKTDTVDATALQTLKTDQQTIFASQTAPTDAQQTQLQADQDAVLKSQGVSQDLIDQLAADRLAVKTASNFTADDQILLDADHKAVEADHAATPPTMTDPTTNSTTATSSAATLNTTATTTATSDTTATTTATSDTAATTTATPAVTSATPTDPTSVSEAPPTDATPSSATPPAPATLDPIISQSGHPSMNGATMRHGRPGHAAHHGRPSADGFGGASHQGQMSGQGATHSRRTMQNGG